MSKISGIVKYTSHRPWAIPSGNWRYYQEWNDALFLHWSVSADLIKALIPAELEVDIIDGNTWISLVAFTMEKIRPRYLPSLPVISDFHEINLRAYVVKDNKPGVYFLNIKAEKLISVLLAKYLSGLPYEKASISRTQNGNIARYKSRSTNFDMDASFQIENIAYHKTDIDIWLTERYCLYLDQGKHVYRYEIHHKSGR